MTMTAPKVRRIPANELTIDDRVQRQGLDQNKLNTIRDTYNRHVLNFLTVSERADGTHVVLDGWHRWTVAREIDGESVMLNCQVFTGLELDEEAELFLLANQQQPASKIDKFRVKVVKGDPVAVKIQAIVSKHGWAIGVGDGRISAVETMEAIVANGDKYVDDFGEELLSNTLSVVTNAWGRADKKATEKNILLAVATFLLALDKFCVEEGARRIVDLNRLTVNLGKYTKEGPGGWLAACRGIAAGSSKTLRQALTGELAAMYNKGPGRKIPDLTSYR